MTKSNWRNELYLGERVGGAGTLVRQGIKVGGKKGGKAVQKGTTAATAAGKTQVQKAKQGNQKKMVGFDIRGMGSPTLYSILYKN